MYLNLAVNMETQTHTDTHIGAIHRHTRAYNSTYMHTESKGCILLFWCFLHVDMPWTMKALNRVSICAPHPSLLLHPEHPALVRVPSDKSADRGWRVVLFLFGRGENRVSNFHRWSYNTELDFNLRISEMLV